MRSPMNFLLFALLATVLFSSHVNAETHYFHEQEHEVGNTTIPKYLSQRHKYNIHTKTDEIVITIDDGPTRGVTGPILDILKKYRVKATFFVVGNRVEKNPKLMNRMVREGHIVANHTYSHPSNIKRLSRRQIMSEMTKGHELTLPYSRNADYFYFRAPGGVWAPFVADIVNSAYFGRDLRGPVLWDIGGSMKRNNFGQVVQAADWACWSRGYSVRQCLNGYIKETQSRRGGVVLFHDLNKKSVKLIEGYVKAFARSHYRFATLNDVRL